MSRPTGKTDAPGPAGSAWTSWIVTLAVGLACGILLGVGVRTLRWEPAESERAGLRQAEFAEGEQTIPLPLDLDELYPDRVVLRRATEVDLRELADKESIQELFLDAPRLRAADYGVLAECPALRHLRIRAGGVDDEMLRHICRVTSLLQLNLPRAQFTDEGLRHLDQLAELQLFRFGSPHVTDEGLRNLSALPRLRFLHIIDTPVGDRGLDYLRELSQLESFYIDGSLVTDAGIESFLQALPQVHFHIDQAHHDRDPQRHDHGG